MSAGGRTFRGGYFFPLNVRAALDMAGGVAYVQACARRALRERQSARNTQARLAAAARQREARSQTRREGAWL